MIGILLITGLCCAGKTTVGEYIGNHDGFKYLNLRRVFESLVGKERAHEIHQRNCQTLQQGNVEWLNMIRRLTNTFDYSQILILEGINNPDEISWIENNFPVNISIINVHNQHRIQRYLKRDSLEYEVGVSKLKSNDNWRLSQDIDSIFSSAVFSIDNSGSIEELYNNCDEVIRQFNEFPNLCNICHHLNKFDSYHFAPFEVIFFIRQLSIAYGCLNACSHCFSAAPKIIQQTDLTGFNMIIREIGLALNRMQSPLLFFHLGAATDPAYIENYASYLKSWANAFPSFQKIKIFTHGWQLDTVKGHKEFIDTLKTIVDTTHDIKFIISFDCFSNRASTNWESYIDNVCNNVQEIIKQLGKDSIRMEVFYPPSRINADPKTTLEYWRLYYSVVKTYSYKYAFDILSQYDDDDICARTTIGVLTILERCGIPSNDLSTMTRDCEMIFNGGRAKSWFKEESESAIEKGYEIQKRRVLYSLDGYCFGNNGLVIYPDGRARIVNYEGFELGAWLNEGNQVLHCFKII